MSETQSPQQNEKLAAAWNTTTPYEQIRTGSAFEAGQYDFTILNLTPELDKNGLYNIKIEAKCDAPGEIANLPGKASIYFRNLYVGSRKDPLAEQPDTRLNNAGLRFLKALAEANKMPCNAMSDAQMCAQLVSKKFGIALVENEYEKDGKKQKGLDFGRTITPAGTIPAKLNRSAAAAASAPTAAPTTGATFN